MELGPDSLESNRRFLIDAFSSALSAVNGRTQVSRFLKADSSTDYTCLLAIGKAACAMAQGALDIFGSHISAGLVITKVGYAEPLAGLEVFESAHPLPDQSSLTAGRRVVQFLDDLPDGARLLVLISGGASSLIEVLPDGISLDELVSMNRRILAEGLSIEQMNSQRQNFSRIKGGQLIAHTLGQSVLQLLISDVPDDNPGIIGSGCFVKAGFTSDNIETHLVATNLQACEAAINCAREIGLPVQLQNGSLNGELHAIADQIFEQLQSGEPGFYIWGGETTLEVSLLPGRGGRCQHLALELARRIEGRNDIVILCAATDGSDGPGSDAGGIVDGATVDRGCKLGLVLQDYLDRCDAGTFLDQTDGLFSTGPTGTNVMDLVFAVKWSNEH